MDSAWTCNSFSWFQSAIVFTKNEFLNCSVWAVGTIKHLVLLVVSCWTTFEDTWSGKCLGLMATVNSNWLALSATLVILQVRESASSRRSQEWISPHLLALVANCDNALNAYLHRRITLPLES